MKPPICDYCCKRFDVSKKGGGLIQFHLTPQDQVYNERFKQSHMIGHKKGLSWFCANHIELAESLRHFHKIDALRVMKETLM